MMRCCCTLVLGGLDGRGWIASNTFRVGCRIRCDLLGWLGGSVVGFGRVPGVLLRVWRWWVRCLVRCTRGAVGLVDVVMVGLSGRVTLMSPSVVDSPGVIGPPSELDFSPCAGCWRRLMIFCKALAMVDRMAKRWRFGRASVVEINSSATSVACSMGVGV